MKIMVRLFAMQRELVGAKVVPLELPAGSTVADAWDAMAAAHPGLAPGRVAVRFARNGDYAEPTVGLADGDEVAFIPPVSGGSAADDEAARPRRILELREEPFPPGFGELLAGRIATVEDGAVVVFEGRTRVSPGTPAPGQEGAAAEHAGRAVEELEYEAHEAMALRQLETIADEIAERFGVERLAIVHRMGRVPLGATSIIVVAASPHRGAAFDAARYAIDETKARVPIWKAERFVDGKVWIGEPPRSGPIG